MHRLRQVCDRLPACCNPHEGLRAVGVGGTRRHDEVEDLPQPRRARNAPHHPGRARRLHRLRCVRAGVPGTRQERGEAQEHQHAPNRRSPRSRAGCVGRLPRYRDRRPGPVGPSLGEDQSAASAAVRVLGGVCRLRRNPLPEAAHAIVRRPPVGGQRHWVQQHLRRQPAHHAVHGEQRGQGPCLGQQPVRGQCRVRSRHPTRFRGATPHCTGAGEPPAVAARGSAGGRSGRGPRRRRRRRW